MTLVNVVLRPIQLQQTPLVRNEATGPAPQTLIAIGGGGGRRREPEAVPVSVASARALLLEARANPIITHGFRQIVDGAYSGGGYRFIVATPSDADRSLSTRA